MATQSLQEKIDELRARINLLGESQISSCYSFGNSDCCYLVCNKHVYVLSFEIACFNDCQIATMTEAIKLKEMRHLTLNQLI